MTGVGDIFSLRELTYLRRIVQIMVEAEHQERRLRGGGARSEDGVYALEKKLAALERAETARVEGGPPQSIDWAPGDTQDTGAMEGGSESTLTHAATRDARIARLPESVKRYIERSGTIPEADSLGHRTRFSDSSLYDEVCILCGTTDERGMSELLRPCPGRIDDIHTEEEAAFLDLKAWFEDAALNLQAGAPDGNNPTGYKGPHPCDCAHFAEDAIILVKSLVAASLGKLRWARSDGGEKCPTLPRFPNIHCREARDRSEAEVRALGRLSEAAPSGYLEVVPRAPGAEIDELVALRTESSVGREGGPEIVVPIIDRNLAEYVVALIRADRRIRSRKPPSSSA